MWSDWRTYWWSRRVYESHWWPWKEWGLQCQTRNLWPYLAGVTSPLSPLIHKLITTTLKFNSFIRLVMNLLTKNQAMITWIKWKMLHYIIDTMRPNLLLLRNIMPKIELIWSRFTKYTKVSSSYDMEHSRTLALLMPWSLVARETLCCWSETQTAERETACHSK